MYMVWDPLFLGIKLSLAAEHHDSKIGSRPFSATDDSRDLPNFPTYQAVVALIAGTLVMSSSFRAVLFIDDEHFHREEIVSLTSCQRNYEA